MLDVRDRPAGAALRPCPGRARRAERCAALVVAATAVPLGLLAVLVHLATPAADRLPLLATPELSAFVAAAVSGAALVRAAAGSHVGRLLLVCGAAGTAYTAARAVLVAGEAPPPVVAAAAFLAAWAWSLALLPLVLVLPLLLPDGDPPPDRWRPLLRLGVASTAVVVVTTALRPGEPGGLGVANPWGVPVLDPAAAVVGRLTDLLNAVLVVFVLVAVAARRRSRAGGAPRPLRPAAAALAATLVGTALGMVVVAHAAAALLPVAVAAAARRPAPAAPDVRALVPRPRSPAPDRVRR